ncbi:hypothetical protein GOP47_0008456 [Adiantum capillus-veneris]|uniref:Spatacsin C-terminal domain-containing protein n=1 Tax=Adiantum capillus-veneris TaxID=13818 RepID=A0A9D4ZKG1_ADICA|nr:hypothetical protein GOP47_0008456 [Adiantum capillus-veneris]
MDQLNNNKDRAFSIKVLRLHCWKDESLPLSNFDEASLSPSRDTLLLQSKKHGAMLVSVRSAKASENAVSASGPPPPPPPLTDNAKPSYPERYVHSTSDRASNSSLNTALHSEILQDSTSSRTGPSGESPPLESDVSWQSSSYSDFSHSPFIADCASYCWGCSTEGYSVYKQVGTFKELLIVVAKHGLVIHGFPRRASKVENQSFNVSQPPGGNMTTLPGRWINWGSDFGFDVNKSEPSQPLTEEEEMGFVTFLVDAHIMKHASTAYLNFAEGSVQPSTGKILSYSIPFNSSAFSNLVGYVKEHCSISRQESANQMSVERVFSGPSCDLVGFLFSQKDLTEGTSSVRCFILVCKILLSGLEWFSVIEPGAVSEVSAANEWPNFSFAGGNLYGLRENGHIYVWSLRDTSILAHIDVLHDCGLHTTSRLEEAKYSEGLGQHSAKESPKDSWAFVYLLSTNGSFVRCKTCPSCAVGSNHIGSSFPCRKPFVSSAKCGAGDEPLASFSSGFSSKSCLVRSGIHKVYATNHHSHPLRRIFMPVEQHSKIVSLCINSFGIMQMVSAEKSPRGCQTSVAVACFSGEVSDDCSSEVLHKMQLNCVSEEMNLPFCSQGYLHYVAKDGLYVILPPLSLSASKSDFEGQWWSTGKNSKRAFCGLETSSGANKAEPKLEDWQFEVLDKALIYDGSFEAEHLAALNGWSQHVVRLRRLQLALEYVQLDQIDQALDGLVAVKGAEFGVARVLFTAVQLMLDCSSGDNELAQASRLLTLAARFATKLIGKYGVQHHRSRCWVRATENSCCSPKKFDNHVSELKDMSRFLEVNRKLQLQLRKKRSRPQPGKKEIGDEHAAELIADSVHSGQAFEMSNVEDEANQLINVAGFSGSEESMWLVRSGEKKSFLSSGEIFNRWEKGNIDLSVIVREALRAGRLPLAVVQLHRLRSEDLVYQQPQIQNTFKEVQGIGRAFVYELLCKGETVNAMIALSRLGEDVEMVLRELAFGSVSRFLRSQAIKELARLGCLNSQDLHIFETISILERAYPNNSFWRSYGAQQRSLPEPAESSTEVPSSEPDLKLLCSVEKPQDLVIACGEIDGVVLGEWNSLEISATSQTFLEELSPGYWAGAAVWLNEWDKYTLNRVFADQQAFLIEKTSWEACLQAAITRHDWKEASSMLDSIPDTVLQQGELQVRLDCQEILEQLNSSVTAELRLEETKFQSGLDNLDVDAVEVIVPKVKFLGVSLGSMCTGWMGGMLEEKLVKNGIFMRSYWYGTRELISLLAKAGLLSMSSGELGKNTKFHRETEQAIHELVMRHCVRFSLPNFMALYLDYHSLALDAMSSLVMQAVVGDCQWALWILLSRIKGREFDASFANARTVLAHNFRPGQLSVTSDNDEFISTVDDMAMAGGEMMALCTLMYAPIALEKCLGTGSVNKYDGPSWQCTLENLRPGLQQYPTLWRALVAACFNPDTWCFATSSPTRAGRRKPGLAGYLQWREQLYSSACGDTSILQMMPRWLPKGVQRLLQLSVQGPVGGGQEVVQGGLLPYHGLPMGEVDPVAWETALQKNIEDELYASSKFEEKAVGVEHHLRRGRAMAAFNAFLAIRLQNLNAQGSLIREHVGKFQKGQLHMSSELHALLSPLALHEEKYLALVLPLAITNFENTVVVASCASFLELCGLSATMLRVDVAALCRISDFCKASEKSDLLGDWSNLYGNDVASSLARALADEYMETGVTILTPKKVDSSGKHPTSRKTSRVLIEVLHILEKASHTEWTRSDTSPGSWLMNGAGDGFQLRDQQREASERWSLVTTFCNTHQLPVSTVYVTALARDNDWVGFLAEAQSEGCPLDVLISVASKEFTDPRLQSHILTVLKSLQSAWQRPSTLSPTVIQSGSSQVPNAGPSFELFEILAECEHQSNPGTALLTKAKDLRWPLLAVVSSCFADVTPLSCLTVWLEITAARETSSIKVNDAAAHIAACVGAAVEATNALPESSHIVDFQYNRKNCKRRRLLLPEKPEPEVGSIFSTPAELKENLSSSQSGAKDIALGERASFQSKQKLQSLLGEASSYGGTEEQESLSKMIAILCEQQRFFPLLKAFELFMLSSSLLPFIRFLQAFSLMRTSEASAHLALFSNRLKEELQQSQHSQNRSGRISAAWITAAAVTAADTMLTACPSAYERRCLLQLLAGADFGDGGVAALRFRRLYWKVKLAEPAFQQKSDTAVVGMDLEDDALLLALETQGKWEEARTWARQLELSGQNQKAVNHVTETQAESMVAEWREFLWDLKEERIALWNHCQSLFLRHSLPSQQAGMFFLKHAESLEQELSPSELHGIFLLALQWLSGSITNTPPSYPIQQLRELETRIWLLAVESQVELQEDQGQTIRPRLVVGAPKLNQEVIGSGPVSLDSISLTAKSVSVVDSHIKTTRAKILEASANEREGATQARQPNMQDQNNLKIKRKPRNYAQHRRAHADKPPKPQAELEGNAQLSVKSPNKKPDPKVNNDFQEEVKDETVATEDQVYWEERVGEQELERAVLSLLEVGQVSAARQLQQKLAPVHIPLELLLVETALNVANLSTPTVEGCVDPSNLHPSVHEHLGLARLINNFSSATPFEVLDALTKACREGCGRGSCKRITAVAHVSDFLDLPFSEAFEKEPTQLLQLLSLKGQDSLSEARLLVETHAMPAASIAKILAESYLKGLLAAHRGGYMESSVREEGPSPLLWRPSDFLKWAELCQSEPEMGHALMRIVISGHEVPHACEVELLVRAHHFYMSSACLDGIDVLLALAATRVESYIAEGDFTSLARLVTGINNFQSLHFMLDILIENGQLELLLQKRAGVEAAMESSASVRGFRMAVLSTLKHFNPQDLDAFAMVYDQFDMKHEMAALVESRARKGLEQWLRHRDPELSDDLLEMMRYNVEAAEVWASVDAGNKARWNCAQASLISLQLRIPELTWLNLNETNARRLFVEQSRFQEALVVAEAYNLNQPGEWVPVLWNQMPNPGWVDQFLSEFVAALPLPPSMLMELARFYRAEVTARGDQIDFSSWLSPGGLPLDWAKYLGKSFRCLLKYVRDMRLRVQLATLATGFPDVLDVCMRILDKVPETAGPLILRKGHGGGYLPLM